LVNSTKRNIALFGGSFDPFHNGHRDIIFKALDILDVSKIVVTPSYLNPFKNSSLIDPNKRLEFVRLALDTIDRVEIEDYEIKANRSVYTFETVKYLEKKYNVKYIIIGADNLEDLRKWSKFEWLNRNFIWVIASRKGYNFNCDFLDRYISLFVDRDISSTEIRSGKNFNQVDKRLVTSLKEIINKRKNNEHR